MNQYLFTSERLGFRNWTDEDLPQLTAINADPEVMEFFPNVLTQDQSAVFIQRMKTQFSENGFCYFAVDRLDTSEFIGFIGLATQTYEAEFTPCVDIGWRLSAKFWGNGYATEGARRCLQFGFEEINLPNIKSVCPAINTRSERVMQKIEMTKVKEFDHSLLTDYPDLERCVLYEMENPSQ